MLKYISFIMLAILCAKVRNFEIFDLAEDRLEEAVESLLEAISPTATNSTETEESEEECCVGGPDNHLEEDAENKHECTGGIHDFIQCVIGKKIETFRKELSKVAFPNKSPQEPKPLTIDSKFENSLEDWIQKVIKHSNIQKENRTSGLETEESEEECCGGAPDKHSEEDAENKQKCTGGLLDYIQCVVGKKIKTFRQELSKVAFPNKPPQEPKPLTIDSKFENSLEGWIQKVIKHSNIHKENCTSDK